MGNSSTTPYLRATKDKSKKSAFLANLPVKDIMPPMKDDPYYSVMFRLPDKFPARGLCGYLHVPKDCLYDSREDGGVDLYIKDVTKLDAYYYNMYSDEKKSLAVRSGAGLEDSVKQWCEETNGVTKMRVPMYSMDLTDDGKIKVMFPLTASANGVGHILLDQNECTMSPDEPVADITMKKTMYPVWYVNRNTFESLPAHYVDAKVLEREICKGEMTSLTELTDQTEKEEHSRNWREMRISGSYSKAIGSMSEYQSAMLKESEMSM